MFRAFFAYVCLVLSIQSLVTAADDINHHHQAPGTVPAGTIAFTPTSPAVVLKGPVAIARQASAVSANLRKKEKIEQVDVEGV